MAELLEIMAIFVAIGALAVACFLWFFPRWKKSQEQQEQKRDDRVTIIKIIWMTIVIGLMVYLSFNLGKLTFDGKQLIHWVWWLAGLSIVYGSLCFRIIRGEEKGIKEIIGIPYAFVDSGPRWVWFPIEKIGKYSKEEQRIDVSKQQIITVPGRVKLERKAGDVILETKEANFSAATITVDVTLYFFWPDGDDLIEAYIKGPDPEEPEAVKNFFEHAIIDATRGVGGSKTWRECTQDKSRFADDIVHALSPEKDPEGPVAQTKISPFRIVITDVKLPEGLEAAITKPQIGELEAEEAVKRAEGERQKRRLEGTGDAEAREAIFKTISDLPEGIAYETLLTLREMADGTSTTLFYGLPSYLSDAIEQALGGKKPEDVLKILGPETIDKMISRLTELKPKK